MRPLIRPCQADNIASSAVRGGSAAAAASGGQEQLLSGEQELPPPTQTPGQDAAPLRSRQGRRKAVTGDGYGDMPAHIAQALEQAQRAAEEELLWLHLRAEHVRTPCYPAAAGLGASARRLGPLPVVAHGPSPWALGARAKGARARGLPWRGGS